jgi:hypothetical protein
MVFLDRIAQGLRAVLILIFQVHCNALIITNAPKILLLAEIYKLNAGYSSRIG